MVQNQVIKSMPSMLCHQKTKKPMKSVKISESAVETISPKSSRHSTPDDALTVEQTKTEAVKADEAGEKPLTEERRIVSITEAIKQRRREEWLAKEKQAEEERERFVKEVAERKAAEREEIIKQAKRFILYRKPMCRRINQGLLISECFKELDAQIKFRETLRNAEREQENAYVKLLKEDVAKYEEEMKRKAEEEVKKRKDYGLELKKQIEEISSSEAAKEKEEFEAEKVDQLIMAKSLRDIKQYEEQQLHDKKEELMKMLHDAIEEKKQHDLKLKHEDEFENRANEIYRNSKLRIRKQHKEVEKKEKQERERISTLTGEIFQKFITSKTEEEEKRLRKAQEEQEEQYQERERLKKEHQLELRKQIKDFLTEAEAAKLKKLQEEKDLKDWEIMQRFKKVEYDKNVEEEERKQLWNKKMTYGNSLKEYISENEIIRKQQKLDEDEAELVKKIIEIENKKVLDYAEEVINESKDVRPLYPILKAVEDCKKEMGLVQPKKREEIVITKPKRRQRIRKCTKFLPEDKVHYL